MKIDQKGVALISVVAILIFLAIIVLSFVLWIGVESKGTVRKQIISKIQYYGETGTQKAIRVLQEHPTWYAKMYDNYTTDYYTFTMTPDTSVPESNITVTIEDIP